MKSKTNLWLVIAVALILIGTAGFFFIMSVIHWDFSALGNAKFRTDTIEIRDSFRDISINAETDKIIFLPAADGKCRVEFYEHEKVKGTASVQGGTLTVSVEDSRKWHENLSLFYAEPKITVYLPEEEYGALSIEAGTGDISIPNAFTFGSMSIRTGTGDVDCDASSEGLIRIKTSTGEISVENITAGELDLSVSTGKITLSSVFCEGDLGISVSTGKTMLKDIRCGNILSNGSTGDITLEAVTASGKITVERSTGDVKFDHSDAAELEIKTGTGNVTGSLRSEKVFIADSHTGRVEVPETTGGGRCSVRTDTGRINITIDPD